MIYRLRLGVNFSAQRVVAPLGLAVAQQTRSFPRKWESTRRPTHFQALAEWTPAFAGMTGGGGAHLARMTPLPPSGRWRYLEQDLFRNCGIPTLWRASGSSRECPPAFFAGRAAPNDSWPEKPQTCKERRSALPAISRQAQTCCGAHGVRAVHFPASTRNRRRARPGPVPSPSGERASSRRPEAGAPQDCGARARGSPSTVDSEARRR